MTMWHCVKNVWGYCAGEPESKEELKEIKSGLMTIKSTPCELVPETCGKFRLASEVNKPVEGLGGTVVEAMTPAVETPEKQQKKGQKTKAEAKRGTLF